MNGHNFKEKTSLIIFGATGDLTYRKLLPALYDLNAQGELENVNIVAIGRREYNNEVYRQSALEALHEGSRFKSNIEALDESFFNKLTYYKMDFNQVEHYEGLRYYLSDIIENRQRYMYYLAVAPSSFSTIIQNLHESQILHQSAEKQLLIEKPFGDDLDSAILINNEIGRHFKEHEIYRIDHYLAKEMIRNILYWRFSNTVVEALLNDQVIDHIQITASETGGVETRGNFYDKTGALNDMVQSHLLQVLSLLLMKRPKSFEAQHVHKQQFKVLDNLKISNKSARLWMVKGQYREGGDSLNYRDEDRVDPNSITETYVALKLMYDRKPFKGIPIYLRTGKRMDKQSTYIAIEFKPNRLDKEHGECPRNTMIIRIGPDEGIYLKVNIKKPGTTNEMETIFMDYCQSCIFENRINTPQDYARIFSNALDRDMTIFTSWPIAQKNWALIQHIQERAQADQVLLHGYAAYSQGPNAAAELLAKDGRHWINDSVLGESYYED